MTSEEETTQTAQTAMLKAQMTADIVAAHVSQNDITAEQLGGLIQSVFATLIGLEEEAAAPNKDPAVPVSRSVHDDYIVCLEDGAKLKMLKRYIRTRYDLTPDDYRAKWGLPASYPMVAPAYSRRRSSLAKKFGLGKGARKAK